MIDLDIWFWDIHLIWNLEKDKLFTLKRKEIFKKEILNFYLSKHYKKKLKNIEFSNEKVNLNLFLLWDIFNWNLYSINEKISNWVIWTSQTTNIIIENYSNSLIDFFEKVIFDSLNEYFEYNFWRNFFSFLNKLNIFLIIWNHDLLLEWLENLFLFKEIAKKVKNFFKKEYKIIINFSILEDNYTILNDWNNKKIIYWNIWYFQYLSLFENKKYKYSDFLKDLFKSEEILFRIIDKYFFSKLINDNYDFFLNIFKNKELKIKEKYNLITNKFLEILPITDNSRINFNKSNYFWKKNKNLLTNMIKYIKNKIKKDKIILKNLDRYLELEKFYSKFIKDWLKKLNIKNEEFNDKFYNLLFLALIFYFWYLKRLILIKWIISSNILKDANKVTILQHFHYDIDKNKNIKLIYKSKNFKKYKKNLIRNYFNLNNDLLEILINLIKIKNKKIKIDIFMWHIHNNYCKKNKKSEIINFTFSIWWINELD